MLFQTISETKNMRLTKACESLGVSRSGYAKWLQPKPLPQTDSKLLGEVKEICLMPRYGYRRVTAELHRRELKVNHKKVLKIMREHGLTCRKHVFHIQTTDSNHCLKTYPNLAKKIVPTALNQLWTTDITYIRLPKGFAYLAAILDRYSRKCIGWQLSQSLDTSLALDALRKAFDCRKGVELTGLIHHSDQGVQYASLEYVTVLQGRGITISMSRKGNPYDNAFSESFNKTVKVEEVYLSEYESFNDAFENIEKFIEEVYNKKRLHSSIGYVPPDEFEKQMVLKRKRA
jgi:transposase InsO family protein